MSQAQDSASASPGMLNFPARLFKKINESTASLDKKLSAQTEKYIRRLTRQEAKLKKKLYELDSNRAKNLFASNPEQQYAAYADKLRSDSVALTQKMSGQYLPYADSLQGMLSFLNKNQQLLSASGGNTAQIQQALGQLQQLQAKMQNADELKQYIEQRKEQIKQYFLQIAHLPPGLSGIYANYNKEQYYYAQQVEAYKDLLNDPDKLFKTALGLLDKLPVFQAFMKNNSILSTLFPVPGNYGSPLAIAGLQTRNDITQLLQQQMSGPNAMTAFNQNMDMAQSELSQLKDKIASFGQGGGDLDIPNYQPNQQKTKTFLQRLEIGTNVQTLSSNYYFPTTSDLGLSLGYKINDKSTIGVGASYKIGWGSDISHVNISSQGAGLRSFLDIKMKGSLYISGAMEYNYQQPIYSFTPVSNLSSWQQSGLIGLSKIVAMNTKMLKNTKLQFLWDFLSYQQVPRTQPFKFRLGYTF
jgi:hypothetical protein